LLDFDEWLNKYSWFLDFWMFSIINTNRIKFWRKNNANFKNA
jgi:hypothetical protein